MTPFEPLAVGLNFLSNVLLWSSLRQEPNRPIPIWVVACQVGGSTCWCVHGLVIGDPYVTSSAFLTVIVQTSSLAYLARRPIRATPSDTRLPCLPPPDASV